MNLRILLVFAIELLLFSKSNAQNKLLPINDTQSLYETGIQYYSAGNYDSAIILLQRTRSLSKSFQDQTLYSNSTNDLGLCFQGKGLLDSALYYHFLALEVDIKRGASKSERGRRLNIGLAYKNMGNYVESTNYILQGLVMAEASDDTLSIGRFCNSLGSINLRQDRFEKAKFFYKKALGKFQSKDKKLSVAAAFHNIGSAYEGLQKYDSALYFYHKARKLKEDTNASSLGNTLHNLAIVHSQLENTDSSFFYYQLALKFRQSIGDQRGVASTAVSLAHYYMDEKDVIKAKLFLDRSKEYVDKQTDREALQELNEGFARFYKVSENMDLAYDYLEKFTLMKDSVFNREKLRTLELQNQYELSIERKEKAIAYQQVELLNLNSKQQNAVILLVLAGFLISLGLINYFFQQRKKLQASNSRVSELNIKLQGANQSLESTNRKLEKANLQLGFANKELEAANSKLGISYRRLEETNQELDVANKKLKEANEKLSDNNKRIEVLSRQNFHFTTNAFAELVGMLKAKTRATEDVTMKELLTAEYLRLETIGLLHRELFKEKTGRFQLSEYLKTITNVTLDSTLFDDHQVETLLQLKEVNATNRIAFDLGIITNEICLNACKYAFVDNQGNLTVSLIEKNNFIVLMIVDDGPGLPQGFNIHSSDSFGMKMIQQLVKGLKGTVDLSMKSGLEYVISVPLKQDTNGY